MVVQGRVMLVAFDGWSDAGGAAMAAVRHFVDALEMEPIEELLLDTTVDHRLTRPVLEHLADGTRSIRWPSSTVFAPTLPTSPEQLGFDEHVAVSGGRAGEVYALLGTEPSYMWLEYADDLLEIARECEIETMIFVGALLADVPHTRPLPTSVTSESKAMRELLDVERSHYEGPIGIMTVLQMAAQEAGIETASVWISVPHYLSNGPVEKATVALVDRVAELVDVTVPLGELPERATAWEQEVNTLTNQNDELMEYVHILEEQQDKVESAKGAGEEIAKEFERYLSQSNEDDETPPAV